MEKVNNKEIKRQIAQKYLTIVLAPIITGLAVVLFWRYVLYPNGVYFSEKAENPILFMIIPVVAFIYVIFASIAVNAVFDKYKQIMHSVVTSDMKTFLLHRDQRLPGLLHVLVGAPSAILILLTLFFNYQDVYIGAVAVFAVVYVVTQTWLIITELDNFHTRSVFKTKTPSHWHKTDVRQFFKDAQ